MTKTKNHTPKVEQGRPTLTTGPEQVFEIEELPDIDDCVVKNITRIANAIAKLIAAILLFKEKE